MRPCSCRLKTQGGMVLPVSSLGVLDFAPLLRPRLLAAEREEFRRLLRTRSASRVNRLWRFGIAATAPNSTSPG